MTRMRLEVFLTHSILPLTVAMSSSTESNFDHRTKEFNWLNFDRIAVDFSVEIEDMRFARRGRVGKRRRNPHTHRRFIPHAVDGDISSVYGLAKHLHHRGQLQIRRSKAHIVALAAALLHHAFERIRVAQSSIAAATLQSPKRRRMRVAVMGRPSKLSRSCEQMRVPRESPHSCNSERYLPLSRQNGNRCPHASHTVRIHRTSHP